ncbi:lipoprotein lipase [Nilaparvata lugens]|uniref:lipoprotein lipase n=1 Tax=Nilaparvata lugens TaxID=108931 RepID=UPI00193DD305|nr:lipoprotein lipase [Nilaparvata lugens]
MLRRSFLLLVVCLIASLVDARPSSIDWKVDLEGFLTPPLDVTENKTTANLEQKSEQVAFYLYSRAYKGVQLKDAPKKDSNAHLLGRYPSVPVKVIIHGWMSNYTASWAQNMKTEYLKLAKPINVIVVNWGGLANDSRYFPAVLNTELVGKRIAQFLSNLLAQGLAKGDSIHLIGHSLGAHVAGVAGHYFKAKLSRITGLDPALPGFEIADGPEILDKDDAEFVDVIHTTAGTSGIFKPIGHADFYPNGGVNQPGCDGFSPDITNYIESIQCGHMRVIYLFIESIKNSKAFNSRRCNKTASIPLKPKDCEEETSAIKMGEHCTKSAKGIFLLETNEKSPYSNISGSQEKKTITPSPTSSTKKDDIFSALDDIFNFDDPSYGDAAY